MTPAIKITFEWDDDKAMSNERKHAVSFQEARTVFANPFAAILDDPHHSHGEKREIIIGHSAQGKLLLVSFTERPNSTIRIISARKTTRKEARDYERYER